jgi:hypothetical protein
MLTFTSALERAVQECKCYFAGSVMLAASVVLMLLLSCWRKAFSVCAVTSAALDTVCMTLACCKAHNGMQLLN